MKRCNCHIADSWPKGEPFICIACDEEIDPTTTPWTHKAYAVDGWERSRTNRYLKSLSFFTPRTSKR